MSAIVTAAREADRAERPVLCRVREVVLPGRSRAVALVALESSEPGRPIVWGPNGLAGLAAAIRESGSRDVEGVVLLGAAGSFGAGADLTLMARIADRAGAEQAAREGIDAFRLVRELPVPSFALLTGPTLGGGLELALHADFRAARSNVNAIGLPEVRLGLVPGWGGAYLLAKLAGVQNALDIIVRDPLRGGRMMTSIAALERGVVDTVLDTESWDEDWPIWVAEQLAKADEGAANERPAAHQLDDSSSSQEFIATARAEIVMSLRGATPAPLAAIDLVATALTSSYDEAMTSTIVAFADVLTTDEARASMYAQRLVQHRGRRPVGVPKAQPRVVKRAAVIGAGLMARQLAMLLAQYARIPVVMTDLSMERATAGVAAVHDRIARLAERGTIGHTEAAAISSLITGSTDLGDISDADFVIEAVFEDLGVKRELFAQLEKHLAPTALLATNTSSLSISELAGGLRHPERVVGFHVFNPVSSVPLLEIVRGKETDDHTLATAFALAAALRRSPVLVADEPGFVVNRLLTRMFGVVLGAIDDGVSPAVANNALDPLGLPMAPLQLLDFVGPAVQLHVFETMHKAYPERFQVPRWLGKAVDLDIRHVLDEQGNISAEVAALLPRAMPGQAAANGEKLLASALDALAVECHIMLESGVVQAAEDIDLCMILGANYPLWLGGITPLLDRAIASGRINGAPFHPDGIASLPSSSLRV